MATRIESKTYKRSPDQNPLGNLACNILEHVATGDEVNTDTIVIAELNGDHTFTSVKLTCDTTRTTTVNIGYLSRDADEPDAPTYFKAAAVLTNAVQEFIIAPKGPDFAHDVVVTIVAIGNLAADDVITVITQSVVSS